MSSGEQCAVGSDGNLLPVRLTDPNNVEAPKRKAAEDLDSDRAGAGIRKSSLSPSRTDEVLEDEDVEMPDLQPVSDSEDDRDDDDDDADPATDTEDVDAAYEHTKALGDADRAAMKSRPKADLTKDIHPLFKAGEMLDPDTGKVIKGHWCLLCQKDGVPKKKCFLLGNVSSRRTHISRNPSHFAVYKRMCEKNSVPIHRQATPKDLFK
ncbi:hypothetical protein B0H11DRAFT_2251687 [Mycena galericulata]|nr:hypothetical protein B0H11DRAFT_2251687 [Mycena galericulata]